MSAARIMMIEDSDAIRIPVVTALTAHGFAVDSAPDGADLEGRLHSFAPDLVILDVMLPGRDGFALLAVIRQTSRAAVLMLTARDALSDRLLGLTSGADD
ncbi:MAG TPA: response regulator, partial [Propionibacteriaceae bacterium]|nr:response regulator [Propionibacteriaceae bacterium]